MAFKILPQSLGEDILEGLIKSEVYKPETNTSLNLQEVALAYKIVPKAVLTWTIIEFGRTSVGGVKELQIPFKLGFSITVNKHAPDNYSGEVYSNGSTSTKFKNKSLAGISLVIMSTLELYELPKEELEEKQEVNHFMIHDQLMDAKINAIVMEKLLMQNMISNLIDKKFHAREAIQRLLELRQKEEIKPEIDNSIVSDEAEEELEGEDNRESIKKLKEFLDKKSKEKIQPILNIGKSIKCDCGFTIRKNDSDTIELCTCFGEYTGHNLNINKSNNKLSIKFPKDFGKSNIEMLLNTLKRGK